MIVKCSCRLLMKYLLGGISARMESPVLPRGEAQVEQTGECLVIINHPMRCERATGVRDRRDLVHWLNCAYQQYSRTPKTQPNLDATQLTGPASSSAT